MKIYLVGGAVRDALMGLPVTDRDWVVVGATPQELLDQGYLPVGRDFPVFLHPKTHEEYALARTERKTAPGYHGFAVHASPEVTLEQDLARRDLTINSIAVCAHSMRADGTFDPQDLVDPYGGQRDIADRVLRHVTLAFREDPVRILRLARFAARFTDFTVAPETLTVMQDMVRCGEADHLVAERVWQELAKGLMEQRPSRMFEVLHSCHALAHLLPELDCVAPGPDPQRMAVLDACAESSMGLCVRYACLTHSLGPLLHDRLRVPTDCRDLALLMGREQGQVAQALTLDAGALVALLARCDAFRKPARFAQLLLACTCAASGPRPLLPAHPSRAPVPHSHFAPGQRLAEALAAAQSVATDLIASHAHSTGLSGPKVGEAIHAARVAAVAVATAGLA